MAHIVFCVINDLTYDQRMIRCCTTLAETGFKVTLVGLQRQHSIQLQEKPYRQVRLNNHFQKGPLYYAEFNLRLYRFLMELDFDIAVACDTDTALPVTRASSRKGKKCVYDAHEWFSEVPELAGRPLVQKVWQQIERATIPRFDLCYTVGDALAGQLSNAYGREFEVLKNTPYRSGQAILPYEERAPVILYQGALNAGRGLEQAIGAMAHVEGFELHLAGEGDLSNELRRLADTPGLKEKVRFLGRITPQELPGLTRSAMIGLNLLSGNSRNYYYSLANKFFDYIQAGVPSVNMQFPEYTLLLDKFPVGYTVRDLDPKSMAAGWLEILQDKSRWQGMVDQCTTARQIFCWEQEAGKLIRMYSDLSES